MITLITYCETLISYSTLKSLYIHWQGKTLKMLQQHGFGLFMYIVSKLILLFTPLYWENKFVSVLWTKSESMWTVASSFCTLSLYFIVLSWHGMQTELLLNLIVFHKVAPYCASKWAVEGLSRAVAKELPDGMAVVALNPGVIHTDMLASCFGASAALYQAPDAWYAISFPFWSIYIFVWFQYACNYYNPNIMHFDHTSHTRNVKKIHLFLSDNCSKFKMYAVASIWGLFLVCVWLVNPANLGLRRFH